MNHFFLAWSTVLRVVGVCLAKSPFVPGFGKGRFSPTKIYRAGSVMGYPSSYGGLEMEHVSKGDVIGYSGTTEKTEHFSFAVRVKNHPDVPVEQGWVVPTSELRWENLPSDNPNLFLFPVQPKNAQWKISAYVSV